LWIARKNQENVVYQECSLIYKPVALLFSINEKSRPTNFSHDSVKNSFYVQ
jgi:hypothetical protein